MSLGIFGTIAGVLAGAVLGGALLGPIGAGVGVFLGAIIGHVAMRFFNAAFVSEAARRPYSVDCPDCGEKVRVYLEPEEARQATLLNTKYRVRECPRWKGDPGCERQCEKQIVL